MDWISIKIWPRIGSIILSRVGDFDAIDVFIVIDDRRVIYFKRRLIYSAEYFYGFIPLGTRMWKYSEIIQMDVEWIG